MKRAKNDEHRIVWRNPDAGPFDVVLICACDTEFRDGLREPAETFWQIHRDSLKGK